MKTKHTRVGLGVLCGLLGITRQGWYKNHQRETKAALEAELIVQLVRDVRLTQPRVGTRKLLAHLGQTLARNDIHIGRDALFDLLRERQMLIRRRKSKPKTTNSNHPYHKYPNLIQYFIPLKANELWVNDITYVDTEEGFVYLFLMTDAYSHKIVGYAVAPTLEARWALNALKMALEQRSDRQTPLIHHSDRGVQYCCHDYTNCLKNQHNTQISMTENSDPRENAVAERLNGILKTELILHIPKSKEHAQTYIQQAIHTYNHIRLHSSVNNLTPEQAHLKTGPIPNLWKRKSTA